MLRRVLIASAAAAMLLITFTPDDAFARRGGACAPEATAAGSASGRLPWRRGRSPRTPGRRCRCARRALWLWRLRVSALRCRCGGGRRGGGRCGGDGGLLPRRLRLRRLRQLDLPRVLTTEATRCPMMKRAGLGRCRMIRLIAIAGFTLSVAVSAHAMTPAPIVQPDSMITEVAAACGVGRTRVNGVCVARTTVRQTRRAVRRCATGMTC